MQAGLLQAAQPFWAPLPSSTTSPSWYGCVGQLMMPYAAAAPSPSSPLMPVIEQQLTKKARSFTIDAILGVESNDRSAAVAAAAAAAAAARQLAAAVHPYFPVFGDMYDGQRQQQQLLLQQQQQRQQSRHLPYFRQQTFTKGKHAALSKRGERCKRVRTIFTAEQLSRLEEEFAKQQYMVGSERFYLATKLRLSEAQVKVWFQNRRIKWRKQALGGRSSPETAAAHSDSDAAFSSSGSDAEDTCSDAGGENSCDSVGEDCL